VVAIPASLIHPPTIWFARTVASDKNVRVITPFSSVIAASASIRFWIRKAWLPQGISDMANSGDK
jgi:hypothetical protein